MVTKETKKSTKQKYMSSKPSLEPGAPMEKIGACHLKKVYKLNVQQCATSSSATKKDIIITGLSSSASGSRICLL